MTRLIIAAVLLVGFAVLAIPRFARMWYLAWFDVEGFRRKEAERVEKLAANRPQSLRDRPIERWQEQVSSPLWLWYNRILTSVALALFGAVAAILATQLLR
ncbi:MAG: hypothetical protein GYB64_14130 [Chloroflexi bacterium]|nr:hypothetical protein [Chloroflexota bacterium]